MFEMNGKYYQTDEETLEVLRTLIPQAKLSQDFLAVSIVMTFGLKSGRIYEQ